MNVPLTTLLRHSLIVFLLIGGLAPAGRAAEPDPRLAGYRTPPGWKVAIAATEPLVINPVTMTFGLDGRLYVVEWQAGRGPNDHIKVLTDTDGDGTFDKADMYMDGLDLPAGVLFWDGWTYVTLDHDVVRFRDKDGDGKFETREVIASGFGNDDSHHRVSGMTMGPDGWIYLTTGDSDAHAKGSDGSTATVLRSGGVFRCKPDGSHMENVAFGMRNPWGNVAFDDEFRIFHTDNDNEGAAGFTGCRILHVVEGGDYGWRLREGARCCQPDYERATWNGGRPGRLGWVAETGRGAPAGLCVLNSAAFPPSTRNLLVYPDVFRKLVRAYKVKPAGATFTVAEEFELLASNDPLFRPDDAEIGPDGALYILDWRTDSGGAGQLSGNGKTGRIYRVTWGGTEKEPARQAFPKERFLGLHLKKVDSLIDSLKSADYGERRAASLELIRRGSVFNTLLASNPPDGKLGVDPGEALRMLQSVEESPEILQSLGQIAHPKRDATEADGYARRHAASALFALRPDELEVGAGNKPAKADSQVLINDLIGDSEDVFVCVADGFPKGKSPADERVLLELAARALPVGPKGARDMRILRPMVLCAMKTPADPEVARAWALALGRLTNLKRGNDGGTTAVEALRATVAQMIHDVGPDKPLADGEAWDRRMKDVERLLTADLVVRRLLTATADVAASDVWLRDGFTRALERLGEPALDALIKDLKSGDAKRRDVALFVLQGWRSENGLETLLAEATSKDDLTASSRVGLFRALREFVPNVPAHQIADWLEHETTAPPEARVEAIRILAALHQPAVPAAGPILPSLLTDSHADVRREALRLAAEVRSTEAKASLIALVKADDRPADERRLALAALRTYEDKGIAPLLSGLLGTSKDAGFQIELLRTLAALDFKAAAEQAKAILPSKNRELRQEAIGVLGQRPETALAVAREYNEGKLPPDDLARVIEAVRPHRTPELQAAMQDLLKKTLLAAPTGAEARRLREYVARSGNADRGKALYLDSKKVGCTVCHRLEGVGGAVGPDLTRIYETLSFDKRVEAILEPSKEIKEGFGTFKVATKDGRIVTGLLLGDTPEGVALKDAQGREVRVPAKEIEEKGPDRTSLMPVGVVGNLSFNEFADLLSFLGDRKAQESLRSAQSPN